MWQYADMSVILPSKPLSFYSLCCLLSQDVRPQCVQADILDRITEDARPMLLREHMSPFHVSIYPGQCAMHMTCQDHGMAPTPTAKFGIGDLLVGVMIERAKHIDRIRSANDLGSCERTRRFLFPFPENMYV